MPFQDLGFDGYPFTWSNGREGDANVQLQLDCAFATKSFLLKFPYYHVLHGNRFGSDHSHLIMSMSSTGIPPSPKRRIFRFEERWTREAGCATCIQNAWRQGDGLKQNLQRV